MRGNQRKEQQAARKMMITKKRKSLMERRRMTVKEPVDRIVFNDILLRKCYGGKVKKTIPVKKPVKPTEELVDVDLDQTSCEVCGGQDREDRLLLCDGCDDGYHMECLTPPLDTVPVEEWFCPVCIAHNRTSGSEQISEEESSSLPTTSRRPSRPTHAIARTQHSERVRANVNRRRITQARTAAQLAPRYMMQSTWLDETINAVVAGFNTAVYVRDLTPRSKSRRRRKTVKRRKTKSKSSATTGGKTNMGVKRWKRKVRKSKLRRKLVIKKETSSRGRIARSLGIKKPKSGSMIPSVYQPSEYSLGSMRAEIGAASLSVYGDPFDLDPFDDREDEIQVPTPSSVLDAKRRGLSCSALRSHQPVARPISAGLSRGGVSVPQVEDVAEEAPVSDLLGSILSGQSMLLMDSSDVVINRDGSLKATKPVSLCLPINTQGSGETGDTPNSETSLIQPSGGAGPSSSPLRRPPPAHSSPGSCSTPQNSTSPPIHFPHLPHSHPSPLGHPHLLAGAPHRPITLNPPRPGNSHLSTNGIRSQPLSRVPNGPSDSPHQDKEGPVRQPPVRKPPPKPVWVDVSVLPRIPKIKRDSTSSANSSSGSSTLPGSSANSLAGNRERTVDQQGTGGSQQNRTVDAQRQRADSTGASSSFSSSFTSTTSSFSASSNSRPSSSSISFRINSSGNPWQAQRLPASGGTLPGGDEEAIKRNNKSKRMLLSLRAKAKEEKSEVYDPFNPTGSDSSDNEPENEGPDISVQNTAPRVPIGFSESACHQIKSEPLDVHSDTERGLEMCAEVKAEPEPLWDRPCKESPHHSDSQAPAGGPALDSTSCEEGMDTGSGGTPGSPFQKTEEHSRSSWSCSEINVKVEVKSEPETGTLPIRPQSKSLEDSPVNLQQASKGKGNGVCKELPSVSGAFNSSNIAKDKEERPHQSQSKDRKRSPSNSQSLSSKDSHKKKHSKLKEKRRSRSRSRDRQRSRSKSRSRSKERRRLRSRDRRCSSSSSSRERKTSGRRASHERNDNRGRERRRKRSKERRRSRSRSFSRSRERRRKSTFQGETKLKRQRSRSTSRERKRREERSEISRRTERSSHKSAEPMSTELHESALRANKTTTPVKTERDARPQECETTVVLQSVKQETTQSVEITAHGLESSRHDDPTRTLQESEDDVSLELLKPNEVKQEEPWPTGSVKELKDIKKEEDVCLNLCGELDGVKKLKKEEMTSLDIFSLESPYVNEIKSDSADLEKSHASLQDEMKVQEMVVEPKKIKIENIWPDEDDSPSCSDNPLVINLDTPAIDAVNCIKEPTESYHSPLLDEDMEMSPLQPPDPPIKQELGISSDEDISVDYLIDNLDFIKKEMSESSVADSTEAVDPKSAVPETPAGNKQTTEIVTAGAKSKSQGKRVTWNLQEQAEPQSENLSKLALFKLKFKQEGSRRSATTPQNQDKALSQAEPKLMASVSSLSPQDESSKPKSHKEVLQDPNQKDKYIKKLHMQERAIEEVKLAIKPFYQKRDITKEEYKEILRKAVQKVCHSKSGEINPVKVANLVKAYVDKYKHAKKHKKEETVQSQHTDSQTPM
ncbi:PHD and RING finger domain-containing protein 1-like [Sinocyclocheilus rhinocerous]|uniref:PHD and RING finger domain-containing protein 1-like n=2 Tax=Sinocyclocheilus rhinocerous TaxID=307959 RepID=UPI0007B84657|nr:PREDICTED: PHD and RING finger domain-containing protein 1-like [Sinocyclocheilus rhinocerous]